MKNNHIAAVILVCVTLTAIGIFTFYDQALLNNVVPDNESTPTPAMTEEEKAVAIALSDEWVQDLIEGREYEIWVELNSELKQHTTEGDVTIVAPRVNIRYYLPNGAGAWLLVWVDVEENKELHRTVDFIKSPLPANNTTES